MEKNHSKGKSRINKTVIIALLWLLIFLTFPSGVVAGMRDVIDDASFVILIILFFLFLCAILGFFSRRINNVAATTTNIKSGGIFK